MLKEPPENTKITVKNGMILMKGLAYIPQLLRKGVFEQNHNAKIIKY
jgi:hypothetical protein